MAVYQRAVNKEILPILGRLKLTDLKPDLMQRFYVHKIKNGQSSHAVHKLHKVLNIALRHAVRLSLIVQNPCETAIPPRPKKTEMQFLDEDQIQVLLSAAREIRDQYYPLYYIAIHTGMRQSESVGHKWDDLD